MKSFEGKKVALNPDLAKIETTPIIRLRPNEDMKKPEKAISSKYKSRSQLYEELKETKANFLASRVGYFSNFAFKEKMGEDCGLSQLCLSYK